jgi:outer membrane protein assembly factor BamB
MTEQGKPVVLYVGTYRYVAAIDGATGVELWRTRLPKGAGTVCVMYAQGCLFASAAGHVFRLSPEDGTVLWHNTLPSMGMGLVTMAVEGLDVNQHAAMDAEVQQRAAQAAG